MDADKIDGDPLDIFHTAAFFTGVRKEDARGLKPTLRVL